MTRLLAESWTLVVASKGAPDHARYATKFEDEVKELVEDFEDGGCDDTQEMSVAAGLNYAATLVAVPKRMSPPLEDAANQDYDDVAREGNKLFKLMKIQRAQFIPVSCVGQVDQSPRCTGLR